MTPAGRARLCALLVLAFLRTPPATADTLADVRARGTLVWGGDQEGGGPYVYPREDDPTRVTGFEVEIAARLAEFLGVRAVFFQGQWDRMPDLLRTRKVDMVLNGYESTPARLEAMEATLPYYVYGLELLSRSDDSSLASWADLAGSPAGKPRKTRAFLAATRG